MNDLGFYLVIAACLLLGGAWGRLRDRRRDALCAVYAGAGALAVAFVLWQVTTGGVRRVPESINVIVVCAALTVGYHVFFRTARKAGNACGRCGYSTRGLIGDACPECGYALAAPVAVISDRRRAVFILLSTVLAIGAGLASLSLPSYKRWTDRVRFDDLDGHGRMLVSAPQYKWIRESHVLGHRPPAFGKPTAFTVQIHAPQDSRTSAATASASFSFDRSAMTDATLAREIRTALPQAPDRVTLRAVASVKAAVAADCRHTAALLNASRAGSIHPTGGAGSGSGTVIPAFTLAWTGAALLWVALALIMRRTAPLVRPPEPLPSLRSTILGSDAPRDRADPGQ